MPALGMSFPRSLSDRVRFECTVAGRIRGLCYGIRVVSVISVRNPGKPEVIARISVPSPQAVLATADRVFISNGRDDSITVISTGNRKLVAEIPLGMPWLENVSGVIPAGLAYDPVTKWLLIAESAINAVGVVNTEKNELIEHIPAGWMPTRVAISGDRVYVAMHADAVGPQFPPYPYGVGELPCCIGARSRPSSCRMRARYSADRNGLLSRIRSLHADAPKPPEAIEHVVLVLKENKTFDEVLEDVKTPGDSPAAVLAFPSVARFGNQRHASGGKSRDCGRTPRLHPTSMPSRSAGRSAITSTWMAIPKPRVNSGSRAGFPIISGTGILASHAYGRPGTSANTCSGQA